MQQGYVQGTPIYQQILRDIRQYIASGYWPPGMRVPPVRELSVMFGVNPNTAQRSLMELEREGLVFTESTTGRFITADTELIARVRRQMAGEYTAAYCGQMRALGFSAEEILEYTRGQAGQSTTGGEGSHGLPRQL